MKTKYIEDFNKAIHHIKYLINDIAKQREEHHKKIDILMKKHDKKINQMIRKGMNIVEEVLELYEELSEENGKKE